MKATFELPEELYRRVKAKTALEGRTVREVVEELFRGYVWAEVGADPAGEDAAAEARRILGDEALPDWFGVLGRYAAGAERHDMDSIRDSIARGIARKRAS